MQSHSYRFVYLQLFLLGCNRLPLLQAGTVMIRPQMFKSNVKPKQINKQKNPVLNPSFKV